MEVDKSLTIDELYQKVKDYELVLTVEASLADALNNRLDKPFLGKFTATPKHHVGSKVSGGLMDKDGLFIEVIRNLKIDWKIANYYLDNILDCWKETGELSKICEYDQFNIETVKEIIDVIKKSNNIFSEMNKYKINEGTKVAVLNFYQFNELDKKILPENYDIIPSFKEIKKELPEFKIFKSGSEIVQVLKKSINLENSNDVGIIVNSISKYNSIIKSMLKAANIPIKENILLNSDLDLRTFIQLIKNALKFEVLTLKDIQPFLTHFGINISIKHNEKLIKKIDLKNKLLQQFIAFLKDIAGNTFKNVLTKFEGFKRHNIDVIRKLLSNLNYDNETTDEKNINRLEYYINTFRHSIDSSRSGVLFVSPKSVAYVDRPLIFFIGMDTTWNKKVIEKPWRKLEKSKEIELKNFKILIQNGEKQYYLVQEKLMNEKIIPCYNFNEIFNEKIEGFSDLPHTFYNELEPKKIEKWFIKQDYGERHQKVLTISQSDLNSFVQCPRDYMLSKLITSEESFYMKRGSLFHDFAEFYLNYKPFVEKLGLPKFYDLILEELLRYKPEIYSKQIKSDLVYGVDQIANYIREKLASGSLKNIKLKGYEKKTYFPNIFGVMFNKPIKTNITEMYFEDSKLRIRGVVDLIQGLDHLLDYKSGRKIELNDVIKNSKISLRAGSKPNFQAILYLAYLRKVTPDEPLKFTFYYFLNDFKDQLAGRTPNIEKNLVTITYFPTFKEFVLDKDTYFKLKEAKVRNEILKDTIINYEKYKKFLEAQNIPNDLNKNSPIYNILKTKLCEYAVPLRGAPKTVEKAVISILNYLIKMRSAIFLKRDLDNFNESVKGWLEELNRFKSSRFPIGEIEIDKTYIDRSLMYYGTIKPTASQEELINSVDGIYLVDAGPGTGKTYTITQRYVHLLESGVAKPDDILMITFTENAAKQMKTKVISSSNYKAGELLHAPISTFHAHCKKLLDIHGFNAPKYLGINDTISPFIQIIDSDVLERAHFRLFFQKFMRDFPKFNDIYRILLSRYGDLLYLIKSLSAKGIFPVKNGWFQKSEQELKGNFDQFKIIFTSENIPIQNSQSRLRSKLSKLKYSKDKVYLPDAPCEPALRGLSGIQGEKQINPDYAKLSFSEDRDLLIKFLHEIYYEYIKFALKNNYLNFSFLIMFSYFLLCENHELREKMQFNFIMVDEFQDTNEIQYKLVLLLSKNGNIFVVGDWKQSIYGFQFASVNNIIEFGERIKKYRDELNDGCERIKFQCDLICYKELKENHRASQKLIDFSEKSLLLRANTYELLDVEGIKKRIVKLKAVRNDVNSKIELISAVDEKLVILNKIREIVNNNDYKIEDNDGSKKSPHYKDIAILARNRKFGLELQKIAIEQGIPVSFEAGVEVFKTDHAILLIAWLRVYNNKKSQKGWAVILEEAGYFMDEIRYILRSGKNPWDIGEYPKDMREFLEKLKKFTDIGLIARKIFDKYGINDGYADKIIEVLQKAHDGSLMNMGQIINFIEDSIRSGATYVIDGKSQDDVVKIQTIHAAKGLEYPIVFVSDVNFGRFPNRFHYKGIIFFENSVGIRQRKIYLENENCFVYDNWRADILIKCLTKDFDEERRLFYVAMTRARDHLIITSEAKKASSFFRGLEGEKIDLEGQDLEKIDVDLKRKVNILDIEKTSKKAHINLAVHSIMEKIEGSGGKGMEYGTKVHLFGERYAKDRTLTPENIDEEHVKAFIDSLKGKLLPEEYCLLPIEFETRNGERQKVVLNGIIDLIHMDGENIQIIDYKTDRNRNAEKEYRKQLSVYYHVLRSVFKDKTIKALIFYTHKEYTESIVPIEPLSIEELKKILNNS